LARLELRRQFGDRLLFFFALLQGFAVPLGVVFHHGNAPALEGLG
jgi:hypothetical protein